MRLKVSDLQPLGRETSGRFIDPVAGDPGEPLRRRPRRHRRPGAGSGQPLPLPSSAVLRPAVAGIPAAGARLPRPIDRRPGRRPPNGNVYSVGISDFVTLQPHEVAK